MDALVTSGACPSIRSKGGESPAVRALQLGRHAAVMALWRHTEFNLEYR